MHRVAGIKTLDKQQKNGPAKPDRFLFVTARDYFSSFLADFMVASYMIGVPIMMEA